MELQHLGLVEAVVVPTMLVQQMLVLVEMGEEALDLEALVQQLLVQPTLAVVVVVQEELVAEMVVVCKVVTAVLV
jgi:hypothetical protein